MACGALRTATAAALAAVVLVSPAAAAALEVDVTDLRQAPAGVTTTVSLRDVLPEKFKRLIEDGGVVHLRIQAEVWERRPAWDRLVYPAVVRVFRISQTPAGREIALTHPDGAVALHQALPNPLELSVRVGTADRLTAAARYYAKVVATLGTIAEREIEDATAAVFGRPEESTGLSALGRTVFQRILQISDYLQSVSAEGLSRQIDGTQILEP